MFAKSMASNLLIKQDLLSFELDVFNLNHKVPIFIDSFLTYGEITGRPCAFTDDSYLIRYFADDEVTHVVLYNDFIPRVRKRWSIAHEFGHIYLAHLDDERKNEVEAHIFASHLLMPDIVVAELVDMGMKDYIPDLFGVSEEAASKKLKWYKPEETLLEMAVLRKYLPFLDEVRRKHGKNNGNDRIYH